MDDKEIELSDVVSSLRKRWKVICSITALGAIISIIVTFCLITPKYTASTKLFIGKENSENASDIEKDSTYNNNDIQMYQKILQTYADIIQTRTLISTVISENNLDLKSQDVLKHLTVTPKDETQIIEVTYVDKDPYLAKRVLESICSNFINYSNKLIPNANIQIVEDVFLPEKPSSPNKVLNIAIGIFSGLVLGFIAALVIDYMDNTFEDKRKLEEEIGITVIGDIPSFELFKRR